MDDFKDAKIIRCFNWNSLIPQISLDCKANLTTGEIINISDTEEICKTNMDYLLQEYLEVDNNTYPIHLDLEDNYYIDFDEFKENCAVKQCEQNKILTLEYSWLDILDHMPEELKEKFINLSADSRQAIMDKLTSSFSNGLNECLSSAAWDSLQTLADVEDLETEINKY